MSQTLIALDWSKIFGFVFLVIGTQISVQVYFRYDTNKLIEKTEEFTNKQLAIMNESIKEQAQRSNQLHQEFQYSMQKQIERSDRLSQDFQYAIQKQTERSDQLHQEFIELLKAKKD